VGSGKATVTLSFPAWKEGNVAPATFEVPIEEVKPTPGKVEKPQHAMSVSASKRESRFDPKTCISGDAGFGLFGVRVMMLGQVGLLPCRWWPPAKSTAGGLLLSRRLSAG
jgi:hypothetical protein